MLADTKVYNQTWSRFYKLRSPNVSKPEKSVDYITEIYFICSRSVIKEYLHLRSKSVLLCYVSVNNETYFGTKQPRSHYTLYKQMYIRTQQNECNQSTQFDTKTLWPFFFPICSFTHVQVTSVQACMQSCLYFFTESRLGSQLTVVMLRLSCLVQKHEPS